MDAAAGESAVCVLCFHDIPRSSQSHSCFDSGQFSVESQLQSLPFHVSFQHGDVVCKVCYHKLLKRSLYVEELNRIDADLRNFRKTDEEIAAKGDLKRSVGCDGSDNTESDAKRVRLQPTENKEPEEQKTELSLGECLLNDSLTEKSTKTSLLVDVAQGASTQQNAANFAQSNGHVPLVSHIRGLQMAAGGAPGTPGMQPQILGVPHAPGMSQVLGVSPQPGSLNLFTQSLNQQAHVGISQSGAAQVMSHASSNPVQYASPGSIAGHSALSQVVYSTPLHGQLTAQVVPVASPIPGAPPQYQYVVVQPQQPQAVFSGQQSQVQQITAQQTIPSQVMSTPAQADQLQVAQRVASPQAAAAPAPQQQDEQVILALKNSLLKLDQSVNFLSNRLVQLENSKAVEQNVQPVAQTPVIPALPSILDTVKDKSPPILPALPENPSPGTVTVYAEERGPTMAIDNDSFDAALGRLLCSYPNSKQAEIRNIVMASSEREKLGLRLCSAIFSKEEMQVSNCHGVNGKLRLDVDKQELIRRILFLKFPSDEEEKVWKRVKCKIDTKCRGARFYLLHHGERKLGLGPSDMPEDDDPTTVTILMQ